jgi:hypothetical protein
MTLTGYFAGTARIRGKTEIGVLNLLIIKLAHIHGSARLVVPMFHGTSSE